MNESLISIIVPVYRVEKYITKCVDSILSQTYKNIEVILVDDGSPDNCGRICDEYAARDSRVSVIHKANGGLSDARNVGIDAANGDLIGFVDSDDYIESDMYEKLQKSIERADADAALCGYIFIDEAGNDVSEVSLPIRDEILSGDDAVKKLATEYKRYYVTAWNKLYRKDLLSGIRFPKGRLHEDEFIAHCLYDRCRRVVCISDILYNYVQRSGSIMSSYNMKHFTDITDAYFDRVEFALNAGYIELAAATLSGVATKYLYAMQMTEQGDLKADGVFKAVKQRYNKYYKKVIIRNKNAARNVKLTMFRIKPGLLKVFKKYRLDRK